MIGWVHPGFLLIIGALFVPLFKGRWKKGYLIIPPLAALIDGLGELKVGDTVDLDFQPDRGTVLRFNEKAVGPPVAGDDLYRAVLKIFVGEHPADKRMKEGLLRGGV